MKVDVERFICKNLLQEFKFMKSFVKIAMDVWWNNWGKENVHTKKNSEQHIQRFHFFNILLCNWHVKIRNNSFNVDFHRRFSNLDNFVFSTFLRLYIYIYRQREREREREKREGGERNRSNPNPTNPANHYMINRIGSSKMFWLEIWNNFHWRKKSVNQFMNVFLHYFHNCLMKNFALCLGVLNMQTASSVRG